MAGRCVGLPPPEHAEAMQTEAGQAEAVQTILWELPLNRLLLAQQRGHHVQLLALAAAATTTAGGAETSAIETYSVALHSDGDAARLHEVVRLAGLNARGAALPAASPQPLVRATLFELLG